jgi:Glycosyltransferase family 87
MQSFFRFSLRPIAIYALMCLFWIGFVIATAYDERNPSILNWVLQGHKGLSGEHYLDHWNVTAAALLAAALHLAIVLFIYGIARKHRVRFLDDANVALVVFSAVFLVLTVLSGAQGDYNVYLKEWRTVLDGADPWEADPWRGESSANAYGPLFNLLAPLAWVNPLANKLLFAFSYLVFVIWLIKDFAPRRGFVAVSWPSVGLWLLNPFPWEQIAYFGYFDVLVGLACVAAVHSLASGKDDASGTYLAFGILLKFMPIVILPFLVFSERRFHFRLLSFCVGVVILGLVASVVVWGTLTFLPLTFAATRPSAWSIYNVLAANHSPLRLFFDSPNVDWLEKPFLLTAGLATLMWCMLRQIDPALSSALAILVTLLFYRVGFANYQMVLFFLISYWAVSSWAQFKQHSILATVLVGYFGVLGIAELAAWSGLVGSIFYGGMAFLLFRFLLGCALFVCLVQLRPRHARGDEPQALGWERGKL